LKPINENPIKDSIDANSTKSFDLVGGNKEWKPIFTRVGQTIEPTSPLICGEDPVDLAYELKKKFELENPRIINPKNYCSFEELCNAIKHQWIERRNRKASTIEKRLSRARSLMHHPVFPIDFWNLNPEQVDLYIQYRKQVEKAGTDAIRNDWKVIHTFTSAYGINTDSWNIALPEKKPPKVKIIPLPPTVHRLIHHQYAKDPYTNAVYQYLMYFSFLLGVRPPSELISMMVDDIFFDDGYLIIHEAKKYGQQRQIFPEKILINGRTRKSFKNWVDTWRPKVVTQYSGNVLFLEPETGKPFTPDYLRQKLSVLGKQVWGPYHPYISRHWCAIARLIQTKVETNNWDVYAVEEWLGHDKLTTTQGYIQFAQNYYRNAPYDWIKAVLKSNTQFKIFVGEDNGVNSKQSENEGVLTKIPPVDAVDSRQVRFHLLLLKKSKQCDFLGVLIFQAQLHLFFFFFCYKTSSERWS
jgi:integrase